MRRVSTRGDSGEIAVYMEKNCDQLGAAAALKVADETRPPSTG